MVRIGILALLIASLLGACSSPSAGATVSPAVGVSAWPSATGLAPAVGRGVSIGGRRAAGDERCQR